MHSEDATRERERERERERDWARPRVTWQGPGERSMQNDGHGPIVGRKASSARINQSNGWYFLDDRGGQFLGPLDRHFATIDCS